MKIAQLKQRCKRQSNNLVVQAIREAILQVIDLESGPGTGQKTCVGSLLRKLIVRVKMFLNPIGADLTEWNVTAEVAEETEEFVAEVVKM